MGGRGRELQEMAKKAKGAKRTGLCYPSAFPLRSGLAVDRQGSRRVRRLLRDFPGGQRSGTSAGTAAAVVVVVAGTAVAAVVVVDVAVVVAAVEAVDQMCSIHASQALCSAAVAPAKRAEIWADAGTCYQRRRPGSGNRFCRKRVSHRVRFLAIIARICIICYASMCISYCCVVPICCSPVAASYTPVSGARECFSGNCAGFS